MTIALQGIGIASSCPIALGPAFIDVRGRASVSQMAITPAQVDAEIARFDLAVASARHALQRVCAQIPRNMPIKIAEFIDAHLLMLEDAALLDDVRRIVTEHLCNAEWALQLQRDVLVRVFDQMDDPYLRTRRDDIEHVVQSIQSFLQTDTQEPAVDRQDLNG